MDVKGSRDGSKGVGGAHSSDDSGAAQPRRSEGALL